ncbi:growth hormone secretagogue receptor type 1 [Lingula anatina]|uniref:Growth hormone secretagogue receptor type 1 n=1 Tax=Lingula anatina TaxID=7574 RepID=A0A1S3HP78_LINAN|nr:growth hormone secretagogue receptor type 1 [Lingula anatina]|eukprot:XP_013387346.1 growth hormone secretagogue receptor type 1 [Lingula anatina]
MVSPGYIAGLISSKYIINLGKKTMALGSSENVTFLNETRVWLEPVTESVLMLSGQEDNSSYHRKEEYIEYFVGKAIFEFVPPFLLVLGTLGNMLCFWVLRSRYMRGITVAFFLSVLAWSDTAVLWLGLSRHMVRTYTGYDIRMAHASVCKLQRFLLYTALDYSPWVLVAVTIERFISICYPYKAHSLCSKRRAKIAVAIIAVAVVLKNAHVFGTVDFVTEPGTNKTVCGYPSGDIKYFWTLVLPWVVLCIYAIGPFTTMLVLNGLLICELWRSKRYHQTMAPTKNKTDTSPQAKHIDTSVSMTIMLLVVTFMFVLLASPSFINLIIEPYWKRTDGHEKAVHHLVQSLVLMLTYTNHSINFILYALSGKRFRVVLRRMLCAQWKSRDKDYRLTRWGSDDDMYPVSDYAATKISNLNLAPRINNGNGANTIKPKLPVASHV